MAKQSKQEKRLAKGLAEQAAREADLKAMQEGAAESGDPLTRAEAEVILDSTIAEEAAEMQGLPELVPEQPAPTATGPVLQVKQGLALRGGRGEWYKLLCKYDGKPVADYIAAGKANPASHYTARSTKCGQPKTPESRLSWFKRAGIVTIKE